MRATRRFSLFHELMIIACILAIAVSLAGCATMDVTNPDSPALTTEQHLQLVRSQLGRMAYDIEVAHENGIIGDEVYGQINLRWKQAAKVFNGVVAGTRPAGDLDQVDAMLMAIQQLLIPVARGGTL